MEDWSNLPATSDPENHHYLAGLEPRSMRASENVGGDESCWLPALMIRQCLLPHEQMPLRFPRGLFEGYDHDVLVILTRLGVACTAFIQQQSLLEEDHVNLVVVGLRRCRIRAISSNLPLRVAVNVVLDAEPPARSWMYSSSAFFPFQIRLFDQEHLREQVLVLLQSSPWRRHNVKEMQLLSCDAFTFVVASIVCVGEDSRVALLNLNGTCARLRHLQSLLLEARDSRPISCGDCGLTVSSTSSMFPISKIHFVNPHGAIHSLLTVRTSEPLALEDTAPNPDHSYFPGYGWIIASCPGCGHHLGWRFVAQDPDMIPQAFTAFSRNSIIVSSLE